MTNGKLRVGVIGLGIGHGHVTAFNSLPRAEVVAICDKDNAWLDHCKQAWGTRYAFSSWEELVACDELDAVAVCLPTVFHDAVTIAALNAGKHVLCEKPMAANAEKAQAMADAARATGKTLMISYNQRFGSDIQYLKKYIDEGHLGDIYFVRTAWRRAMGAFPRADAPRLTGNYSRNWFNEKSMGGGVATDLGSHIVDLAMYLTGFPKVKQVVGVAYNKFLPEVLKSYGVPSDADDHSVGFAKFENGMSMQFEASFGSYIEQEKIVQAFYGDKGGAHRESGQPVKLFGQAAGQYVTTVPRIDMPGSSPMEHFVDCVLEGKTPIVTPEQGVAVTAILDGIYKSTGAG
ncbi:MAG: Gfo/Idh/MocA family oxidoreductase [Armatimonadota bacterium]|nr:Gfo/Idh/MocA family oxidoreductase [Armatimonadota bacterium]